MKKWLPIIITCLVVLGLRLPGYIVKKRAERLLAELEASGKLEEYRQRSSGARPSSSLAAGGQLYSDPYVGFVITLPAGWTVKEPISDGTIVTKATLRGEKQELAALNVRVWQPDNLVNLATMSPHEVYERFYGTQHQLLDCGTETISGHCAVWVKMKGTWRDLPAYGLTYILEREGTLFSLDGNTIGGDASWFEAQLPALLESVRSFRFTN